MPRYVFNGRVLPERVSAGLSPPQSVSINVKEADLAFEATISVGASQIVVTVDTDADSPDIETLKNYVEWSVRLLFDANGYLECRGYDIEISSVVEPNGRHTVFGVEVGKLKSLRVGKNPIELSELWNLLNSGDDSMPLQGAMGNLREAIKSPADTGMFCFRAIESMRQRYVKEQASDDVKLSWERMSSALRINQSFVSLFRPFATAQRHGESPYMSGDERIRAMDCAWQVVDRYVEYAQRGFEPLPESEFDILK